ncbi:MAG TPA: glycoside hydrolase family 43 protein [Propionibacteriaceae bacterium]|nr:glycoside hydrolase family 43 protein [Propionibacteriaceae bacterium]
MQFSVATARRTYRNPVYDGYFADPFVLRWEGRYVAYGTGSWVDGRLFEVLESPDLATWTRVGGAMEPIDSELGTDCWAPEVVEADGRFWLYYSVGHGDAGHHLRVAVAEHPFGPFVDTGVNLTPHERFAIDPHPFCDIEGTWYLFYARDVLTAERVGTQIAVDTLPSMTALGGAARTVLEATADWQLFQASRRMYGATYDWYTLEGPTVRHHDGVYYCFYSGGSWMTDGYAVAWASAPSPFGPWTEPSATSGRLLAAVPGHVRGPGHNSLVTTYSGTDVLVYHAWDEATTKRMMCIDPVEWRADGPHTPGPSWKDRPLPA